MRTQPHLLVLGAVISLAVLALEGCNCPGPDGGTGGGTGAGGGAGGGDGGACTLKPNGATCAADGECCSNRCNPNTKVCDTGAGTCKPLGAECISNVECCGGKTCAGADGGARRCRAVTCARRYA